MIAIHSPQSWGHFNLLGEYEFSNDKIQNNTGVLPPNLSPKSFRKIVGSGCQGAGEDWRSS